MQHAPCRWLLALTWLAVAAAPVLVASAFEGPTATVVALTFNDLDQDGQPGITPRGRLEPVLIDALVVLYRDNEPFYSFGAEDVLIHCRISDWDGFVIFREVPVGLYFLQVGAPQGYQPTGATLRSVVVSAEAVGAVLEYTFGMISQRPLILNQFFPLLRR